MPWIEPEKGSLWRGLLFGVLVNIAMGVLSVVAIAAGIGIYLVAGFGVIQAVWMFMFYSMYRRRGATETAKGILVAAGLTFLLWSLCMGALYSGVFRIAG
jgi:hypothetical protein